MLKIEDFGGGEKGVHSDTLPYLTLIRNADEHKKTAGWHAYMDEPTYPCWMMEVEHRCDSTYYYFQMNDLQQLLELLKGVET